MSITTVVANASDLFDANVRFVVPPFQRRYVWDEEAQWAPLWSDVTSLAEQELGGSGVQDDEPHFLGALVLHQVPHEPKEPTKREVIDGQQRLTTLQILIDATESVFRALAPGHADDLAELILNSPSKTKLDADHRFKVWPTRHDRSAFRAAMDDQADSQEFASSKIVQAHNFFEHRVREWLSEVKDDEGALDQRCQALVKTISQQMRFVVINVEAGQAANSIFETLNARGTPLLAWDLVKNVIYERAGQDPDFEDWFEDYLVEFDVVWWQTQSGVGRNQRSNIDAYLAHFLTLRTKSEVAGKSSRDLFRAFSTYATKGDSQREKSIKGIGTDLSRVGKIYQEMMQSETHTELGRFLYHWKVGGHGVLTPVILWLLSHDLPNESL